MDNDDIYNMLKMLKERMEEEINSLSKENQDKYEKNRESALTELRKISELIQNKQADFIQVVAGGEGNAEIGLIPIISFKMNFSRVKINKLATYAFIIEKSLNELKDKVQKLMCEYEYEDKTK